MEGLEGLELYDEEFVVSEPAAASATSTASGPSATRRKLAQSSDAKKDVELPSELYACDDDAVVECSGLQWWTSERQLRSVVDAKGLGESVLCVRFVCDKFNGKLLGTAHLLLAKKDDVEAVVTALTGAEEGWAAKALSKEDGAPVVAAANLKPAVAETAALNRKTEQNRTGGGFNNFNSTRRGPPWEGQQNRDNRFSGGGGRGGGGGGSSGGSGNSAGGQYRSGDSNRGGDYNRGRSGGYDSSNNNNRAQNRDDKDRDRDNNKERERDRDKEKDKERDKDRERDREREREKGRDSRDRGKDRDDRDKRKDSDRDRRKDRDKSKRSRSKSRSRSPSGRSKKR